MDIQVSSFADLMNGRKSAEIVNPLKGNVVRRLTVVGDQLFIFASHEYPILHYPLATPVRYEEWFMDRGSLLFDKEYKICTEMDTIRYKDGTQGRIFPKERS